MSCLWRSGFRKIWWSFGRTRLSKRKPAPSPDGTARAPADGDIFDDDGPQVPSKDRSPEETEDASESSEAGGVD